MRKLLSLTGKAKLLAARTVVPCSPKRLLWMPVSLPHIAVQAWSLSTRQTYWIPKGSETRENSWPKETTMCSWLGRKMRQESPSGELHPKIHSKESYLCQVQHNDTMQLHRIQFQELYGHLHFARKQIITKGFVCCQHNLVCLLCKGK